MPEPLEIEISVIVPVYNCVRYLDECLGSLCAGLAPHYEIILVDDGSTDGSGMKCDTYAAEYSEISVIHCENGGVAAARNIGLGKAIGRYVSFIDADDWVTTDYFPTLSENIKKHGSDFFYFDFAYDTGERERIQLLSDTPLKMIEELWETYRHMSCCKCVIKRDIICANNIWFHAAHCYGEDQEFALKALLSCANVTAIDCALYIYRKSHGSAMNKITYNQFHDVDAMRSVLEYAEHKFGNIDKLRKVYSNDRFVHSIYVASYHLLRAGERPLRVLTYIKEQGYIAPIKSAEPYPARYRRFCKAMAVSPTLCIYYLYLRGVVARIVENCGK